MNTVVISAFNPREAEAAFKARHPEAIRWGITQVTPASEGKLCATDDRPNKGTRKWVTKYYVYEYAYKYTHTSTNEDVYVGMKRVGDTDDKTSAIKLARELALSTQQRMTVRIVKILENDSNIVADIEPKRHNHTYRFSWE